MTSGPRDLLFSTLPPRNFAYSVPHRYLFFDPSVHLIIVPCPLAFHPFLRPRPTSASSASTSSSATTTAASVFSWTSSASISPMTPSSNPANASSPFPLPTVPRFWLSSFPNRTLPNTNSSAAPRTSSLSPKTSSQNFRNGPSAASAFTPLRVSSASSTTPKRAPPNPRPILQFSAWNPRSGAAWSPVFATSTETLSISSVSTKSPTPWKPSAAPPPPNSKPNAAPSRSSKSPTKSSAVSFPNSVPRSTRSIIVAAASPRAPSAATITIFSISAPTASAWSSPTFPAKASPPLSSWPIFKPICAASAPSLSTTPSVSCNPSINSSPKTLPMGPSPPSSSPIITSPPAASATSTVAIRPRSSSAATIRLTASTPPPPSSAFSKNGIAN